MSLKVYNSLTRKKEDFRPQRPGEVLMYVCGPTVYDLSHIGHARSAVCFDVIYRYLSHRGFKVTYARNYTDIDDKIIQRANEEGVDPMELAERYIKAFDEDMEGLGVLEPTYRPRATETIGAIISFITTLIEKGFAYVVDGDVFYSVRRFPDYGKLSGKKIDELEAGARVDVDERKKDPMDFALWKASKPGEPWWESPWGRGRPGWHIECSAMCLERLGETLDIHGGGKDLIFPHHENEIAQSEARTGKPFVRYWLHNGFVNIEKQKMSKSLGNILNIRDVLKNHSQEAVRLFLLSSHYRSPIDYSPDSLREAEAATERVYRAIARMEADWADVFSESPPAGRLAERMAPIIEAMDDDFNTALAIGHIFEEVNEANRLMDRADRTGPTEGFREAVSIARSVIRESGGFLGLFQRSPEDYFKEMRGRSELPEDEIERLIRERDEARKKRDFKRADEIREMLKKRGIILEDTPKGTVWTVKG